MKELFIIRGLPGAGKTTLAKKIAEEYFEADMFFMCNGEYRFDKDKVPTAHEWCQYQIKNAMIDGVTPLAVSNTFVKLWEMSPYYSLAVDYGYTVTEITVTGKFKNIHGVPPEVCQRMQDNWER